jgi:hypothetical protein
VKKTSLALPSWLTAALVLAAAGSPGRASGTELDLVLEAYPMTWLLSPDVDDFSIFEDGRRVGDVDWPLSSLPSVRLGLGADTPLAFLDATAGGGVLVQGSIGDYRFLSPYARLNLAAHFKVGGLFTVGPHVAGLYFAEPEWLDDGDADFSDTWGWAAGLSLTVGGKPVSLAVCAEYLCGSFDVDRGSVTSPASRNELDFSGAAVTIGILCRF